MAIPIGAQRTLTTQFVLVRHATCAQMDEVLFGRHVDAPLDERGVRQAALLADRFARGAIEPLIYASPRRRTCETAAAIATRTGADVRVCAELDEIDFGRWAGRSFIGLNGDAEWLSWNEERSRASTPAGETIASVQQRIVGLLCGIDAMRPQSAVIIVTHSEIIRSLLLYGLNVSPDLYDRLTIDPASITTVELDEAHFRAIAVNERLAS